MVCVYMYCSIQLISSKRILSHFLYTHAPKSRAFEIWLSWTRIMWMLARTCALCLFTCICVYTPFKRIMAVRRADTFLCAFMCIYRHWVCVFICTCVLACLLVWYIMLLLLPLHGVAYTYSLYICLASNEHAIVYWIGLCAIVQSPVPIPRCVLVCFWHTACHSITFPIYSKWKPAVYISAHTPHLLPYFCLGSSNGIRIPYIGQQNLSEIRKKFSKKYTKKLVWLSAFSHT